MSLNIVADENIPAVDDLFGDLGPVRRVPGRALQAADVDAADILLVRSVTRVDEALLAGSRVSFVGTATSGVEHIDRDFLAAAGIGFAAAPGANANSVVEYVLAAMAAFDNVLEGLLSDSAIGIVGYGAIGRTLVQRLRGLDIRYRVYDPWLSPQEIPGCSSLEQVLECDVITLHPELTGQAPFPSRHLLQDDRLRRLHGGQLLINASRGAVVDNAALRQRLQRGDAPRVVLDVWEGEPAIDRELLDLVDIGTPHIAGYSLDGKLRATSMLRQAWSAHAGGPAVTETDAIGASGSPLALSAAMTRADAIRHLVGARYAIRADDAALRAGQSAQDEQKRAAAFDALRKHYPVRRELAGSTVTLSAADGPLEGTVHGLGCRVRRA